MTQSTQSSPPRSRREKIIITGLIVAGLVLVIFFGLRTVVSYLRIHQTGLQPGVTEVEAIRGWMTIPYIAKAYKVPEDYIFERIGIPPTGNHDKNLGQLNRLYAPDERGAVIEAVKAAIRQYQAENPLRPEVEHERR